MAWNIFVALYSIAGGVFLLIRGQFLFFINPEWFIYGGIGVGVGAVALINVLACANRSYIWTRVTKFLWPFIIVICAVRATLMIVQLNRGKDKFQWECDNGRQLWTDPDTTSTAAPAENPLLMPELLCRAKFPAVYAAFVFTLLIDIVLQIYAFFMNWRYQKRLEHYSSMKGPYNGGYYNA